MIIFFWNGPGRLIDTFLKNSDHVILEQYNRELWVHIFNWAYIPNVFKNTSVLVESTFDLCDFREAPVNLVNWTIFSKKSFEWVCTMYLITNLFYIPTSHPAKKSKQRSNLQRVSVPSHLTDIFVHNTYFAYIYSLFFHSAYLCKFGARLQQTWILILF